jgi:DME family drug/metabolite transporter
MIFKMLDSMSTTNALSLSFLRLALSVPFTLLAARLTLGRWVVPLTARGTLTLVGVGAGMALYQVTYILAIERVGVALATLISMCGQPVVVALISALSLRERLHSRSILALIAAVTGAALLVGFPTTGPAPERYWEGIWLAVASAVVGALFVFAARAANAVAHPLHSVGIGFGFGALLLLPCAAYSGLALRYPTEGWLMLIYVAAVPTAIGQTMFLTSLKTTGAIGGAIGSLLEPLVSTILAVLLLGEQIGVIGWAGAVILLAGIVLAQGQQRGMVDTAPPTDDSQDDADELPRRTVPVVRAACERSLGHSGKRGRGVEEVSPLP